MKALIQDDLLRHSDVDVKVAVASCISEITRITAPDAPYDDDQMRDVFQLIVSSFEDLADQDYHRGLIYSSMENIMILAVLPIAQKLGEDVLKKYAEKLKPYLMQAPTALGDSLDAHTEIVTRVCEGTAAATIWYQTPFYASGKLIVLDIAVMISRVDLAAMGGGAPPSGWLIGFLQFLLTY
ncbi:sister chromatid cohesion protein PDS5-like protein isoform X1 [Tanacetum coccineum]